jgi:hypothetical protein
MGIAQQLKRDRERRLLTWAAYAELIGMSERAVYAIAAGATPSTLSKLKIQRVLKSGIRLKADKGRAA